MATQLVILGATGDLTSRYLVPALADLKHQADPPLAGQVIGVGLESWDTAQFRRHLAEQMEHDAAHLPASARDATIQCLDYRQADVTDPAQLAEVLGQPDAPLAVYLALPPEVSAKVIQALAHVNLPEDSRIVIEKPFGHDLDSAKALNDLILPNFPEQSVYRIDHFLGKQTVQNVLGLRFANRVFEYLWNRDHIERVEITWDETVALEGRAGYYDHAGALRDMVQNHLLQLLCLVAMEVPASFSERDFRDRKLDVLRSVRKYTSEEVAAHTVRARYDAGQIGDRTIPNYVDEPGVDPDRQTETFARVELMIDNWRWAGVPFVLRTGKALGTELQEILVKFRPIPIMPFGGAPPASNALRLRLNPDRMELGVNINGPGDPFDLEWVGLEAELAPQESSAYARLLLDIIEGNPVLSIRGDEAEEAWRIVEPILDAWGAGKVPMSSYPAGSDGP